MDKVFENCVVERIKDKKAIKKIFFDRCLNYLWPVWIVSFALLLST